MSDKFSLDFAGLLHELSQTLSLLRGMIDDPQVPQSGRFDAIKLQIMAAETYGRLLLLHDLEGEQRYIERALASIRRDLAAMEGDE